MVRGKIKEKLGLEDVDYSGEDRAKLEKYLANVSEVVANVSKVQQCIQEMLVKQTMAEDREKMVSFIMAWYGLDEEKAKAKADENIKSTPGEHTLKVDENLYIQVWYLLNNTMTIALVHSTNGNTTRNEELCKQLGTISEKLRSYSPDQFADWNKEGLAENKYCQLSQVGHIVGRNFLYTLLEELKELKNNKKAIKDAIKPA